MWKQKKLVYDKQIWMKKNWNFVELKMRTKTRFLKKYKNKKKTLKNLKTETNKNWKTEKKTSKKNHEWKIQSKKIK